MLVRGTEAGAVAPIVGRAQDLAALATAVARPPTVVVVEGEAGIGKTRLIGELAASPELAGRRLIVGGCHPIQEPLPLGPVLDAVRTAAASLVPAQLSPVAGVLRPLLPELATQLPPPLEPLWDRMAERHRVFRGLTEVLRALAPVALALDDLHWADGQTLDFLRFLLHEVLPGPPIALSVVVTFRGEDADPRVPALFARLPPSVARQRLVLTPLDAPQTGKLVAALVGADRVSSDFANYLCEWTGGLPFAIEEVMALLRDRGQVWRRGDRWARRTLDALAVPAGIRDHVRERAALLPAAAQPVLEAAAVLRQPAPEPLIAAVSGQPAATAAAGLSQAIDAGLLREQDERIGFRHALATQAIYHGIPGPRRRELHDQAARASREQGAAGLGQVAYHLRYAGRVEEWMVAAEEAADQAVALGHDDEAARLLEELLGELLRRNGRDDRRTGRVAVKLARAVVPALHLGEEPVRLLQQVLERQLQPAERAEVQVGLAMLQERVGGESSYQRRLFAAAVDDLTDQPELRAMAMVGLAIPAVPGIAAAEYRSWQQRLVALLPTLADPALRLSMLGKVAMVQVATGDPGWRELTDRILIQTGGTPREFAELAAFQSVGTDACAAGHLATADRLLSAALAGAVASRTRRHELLIRSTLVLLDYCRGRWEGLARRTERLVEHLDDQAAGQAKVELVRGGLALAAGDFDRADRWLSRAAERQRHVDGHPARRRCRRDPASGGLGSQPRGAEGTLATTAVASPGPDVYQQGGGRLDLPAALDNPVLATRTPLDLGFFPYPHDDTTPATSEVGYHNRSSEPVTLELALEVTSRGGGASPAEMLAVSPAVLTVDPAATATASVTVDVQLAEIDTYGGYLLAASGGEVVSRVPVGFTKEPEMYDLVVEGITRGGQQAGFGSRLEVVNVDGSNNVSSYNNLYVDGSVTLRLPPGVYSLMSLLATAPGNSPPITEATFALEPEIDLQGDTTVVLDATEAVEITTATPQHPDSAKLATAFGFLRQGVGGASISSLYIRSPDQRYFAIPTDPVELGQFEFFSDWRRGSPADPVTSTGWYIRSRTGSQRICPTWLIPPRETWQPWRMPSTAACPHGTGRAGIRSSRGRHRRWC